ncbi:L,D-transpeptidase family protein [Spiribacter sp. 218]|uniref:L,D-transpeptidase family protein n=1 Tax=Spiribacter pallidus TaxID=1987936 RepID=UPI00349FCAD2
MTLLRAVWISLGCLTAGAAQALTYPLPPPGSDVVGAVQQIEARESDTLLALGRQYGIGYEEMRRANPGVDVWLPGEGTSIIIPSRFVLPNAPREGVVINIPEMRLYHYPEPKKNQRPVVETYPISVGRMDWSTPLGVSRITEKTRNPYWFPPDSILEERAAQGRPLPEAVPPGPDNPLGRHKMRLSIPGGAYLIHGTNEPRGIGMRVTHGCIRMFPEDVESLFERLPEGTQVRIVNQPVKAGWLGGNLAIEAHPVLPADAENAYDPLSPPPLEAAVLAIAGVLDRGTGRVDNERLVDVVDQASGMPALVSRDDTRPLALEAMTARSGP